MIDLHIATSSFGRCKPKLGNGLVRKYWMAQSDDQQEPIMVSVNSMYARVWHTSAKFHHRYRTIASTFPTCGAMVQLAENVKHTEPQYCQRPLKSKQLKKGWDKHIPYEPALRKHASGTVSRPVFAGKWLAMSCVVYASVHASSVIRTKTVRAREHYY